MTKRANMSPQWEDDDDDERTEDGVTNYHIFILKTMGALAGGFALFEKCHKYFLIRHSSGSGGVLFSRFASKINVI